VAGDVVVVEGAVEAGDAVGNGADGAEVVADEDDRQPEVRLKTLDEFDEPLLAGRVDAGRRLVQEQQLRAGREGARDVRALQLPAGQFADGLVGVVGDADALEQRVGEREVGRRVAAEEARLAGQPEPHDLADAQRELRRGAGVLGEVPDHVAPRHRPGGR
jgi:hypothetical protein